MEDDSKKGFKILALIFIIMIDGFALCADILGGIFLIVIEFLAWGVYRFFKWLYDKGYIK